MAKVSKAPVVWFGTGSNSGYRAQSQTVTMQGTGFDLQWPDQTSSRVTLQILGEHHVMNALASATVADQLGIPRHLIVEALEAMPLAERWRMQLTNRPDGVSVINDAYNASPDSMKAALQTLAQLGKSGRRTIAVLGEMAELGKFSAFEHDNIGRLVVRMNIRNLVVIGAAAKLIHMGATQEGSYDGESIFFDSIGEALPHLRGMLTSGDIVLVKSSKSANLRHLGDQLVEAEA
jgi:UDP-N-acetylmuramoyl-tripeptide--D-alanyl-D-alanine ligase